jgi:hypothetical protein
MPAIKKNAAVKKAAAAKTAKTPAKKSAAVTPSSVAPEAPAADAEHAQAPPLRDDILWGADAIADEIGRPVGDVYYLLQRGMLPATKTGKKTWTTTRSKLRAHFNGE